MFEIYTFLALLSFIFVLTIISFKREGRLLNILNVIFCLMALTISFEGFSALYDMSTLLAVILLIVINFFRIVR